MANRKAKPIRVYEFNQTSFNNNGICTLFPKSAVITRDLNEYKYYLDLTHPIDETGKWKEITEDRIIVANGQPFRIKFVQKTMKEIVAYCEQIFFDLNNNFIEDTNIKGKNGNTALNQILSNTNYAHPFSGTSNIQITNNSRLVRKNVLSAIIGDNENSFVNRWGGELDIDGFTFKINTRIGRNNGYKVEYSKNMTGINAKFDMRNVVTKIRPVGFDGIKLEELFVDSPLINSYAMPIIREYKYEDVKWKGSPNYQAPLDGEDDGAYETLAEAQAELKRRALAEFSENEVDLPTVNYNVNFVELSNTDEYANYQALSSINIGDDVVIRHKILDIDIPARCTAYKYNCLTCNFDEITLGHYNKNFFTDVKNAVNDINGFKDTLQELPKQLNDILQQSKEYVTDFINGGFGGYVYYTPNAIYILDNPDVNVAKNVAVFNMNGLGFSNDGINGTFETAITRDGHIVADFIDTGILTADIIKTGILESKNGKSWLNMLTGEFNFGDKVKYENGKFEIIVESSDGGNTSLGNELNNIDNKIDSIKNEAINSANNTLTTTISNYYTKEQTNSQIDVAKEAINLGVSNTYETKTNVETKVASTLNSAKSYSDKKKTEAINTASTDATNKVNSAKTELNTAIGKKANSVDVYTKSEVYTKTQTDSAIKVAKDEINLGVSNKYETKTNVTNKINAIQVGGTNLLPNTKTLKSGVSSTSYIISETYLGLKVMRCNNTSGSYIDAYRFNSLINVEPNTEYTLSFYAKGSGAFSSFFYPNNVSTGIHSNGSTTTSNDGSIPTTVTSSWKRYWITWKTASDTSGLKNVIICRVYSGADIYICGAKFEKGNKASEWSPCPDDIETTVSTIEQRVSAAESKITDTAITNVVKQNFYTKSETDKQITSKGYQTASQVQQTVNNLQIKFTESGGYNLLRNGKAALNTNFWVSNGGGISRGTDTVYKTCFKTSSPSGIKYNGGDSGSAIRLKNNTHYVYEAMVYSRTAIGGSATTPLHFWCGTTATTAGQSQCTIVDYQQAVPKINTWTKCYVHILTKASGEVWFTPFIYPGGGLTGEIWVTELSLSESSIQMPYSPHPSEVYDGITTIDKDGVTVTSSNVRSKTKMSADGFQLIRTTDNKKMFYVNQDGSLEMSGNFTQYDTNGKISIKIANNSYGCYDWLWNGDYVGNLGAFDTNRTSTSGTNTRFIGLSAVADYGNQLVLGVRSSPNSTNFNTYMEIDNTGVMHHDYVTFTANTGFKTNALFRNPNNNYEAGRIFGATNNHFFVTCNHNNQLRLGYEKNGSYYPGMSIYRNDNTSAGCAIEYHADEVHHNNVVIEGFLSVRGQKNRLVATENFGDRLLNAYETAECYFGDINETIIGEDGEVKVELDEVFLETVNTTEPYQVFLTKYGEGDCYVSERHEKYFVIKGTPNLSVGFEVKAKQRGYEKERLKMTVDTLKSHQTTSLEDEAGYTIDCVTTINRG